MKKSILIVILFFLTLIIGLILGIFFFKFDSKNVSDNSILNDYLKVPLSYVEEVPVTKPVEDPNTKILALGDIALLDPIATAINTDPNYTPFASTKDYFSKFDYVVGTHDATIDGTSVGSPNPGKAYTFSTPKESARVFKEAGISAFSYAGNHTKDFGAASVNHTIELLHEQGIGTFGAGANNTEAYAPLIVTIKNTKVAFLGFNCMEYDFNHATDYEAGTASFSEWRVRDSISNAKKQADVVIVFAHWGIEHTQELDPTWQVQWAGIFTNAGADIVMGGHSHVRQKQDIVNGKPVFYSLGNFIYPGQGWDPEALKSYAVELVIENKVLTKWVVHNVETTNEGDTRIVD